MQKISFDSFLVDKGIVNPKDLPIISMSAERNGVDFGTALLNSSKGAKLTDDIMAQLRAEHIGAGYRATAEDLKPNQDIIKNIGAHICTEILVCPCYDSSINGELILLCNNPHNPRIWDIAPKMEGWTGDEKHIYTANKNIILTLLDKATDETGKGMEDLEVGQILEKTLNTAVAIKISDIHIIPQESGGSIVYFRELGRMVEKEIIKNSTDHNKICNMILNRANADAENKNQPIDTSFVIESLGVTVDVRVSMVPTVVGLGVVLRLFTPSSDAIPKLETLGHSETNISLLSMIPKMAFGIILVVGPTGSGKSTTLHSILSMVDTNEKKVVTAEDPVERKLKGIQQVQINRDAGVTFLTCLKAFLRQDPDVILIGEIRDSETAEKAIEASNTGHLVLTTLHANNSSQAIPRIKSLGIDMFQFADALRMVVSQRILRILCPECSRWEDTEHLMMEMGIKEPHIIEKYQQIVGVRSKIQVVKESCGSCGGEGIVGRRAVSEVMVADPELRRLIIQGVSAGEIEKTVSEQGFKPMFYTGIEMIKNGEISVSEFERSIDSIGSAGEKFDYGDDQQ